jgi:hypothetical protein
LNAHASRLQRNGALALKQCQPHRLKTPSRTVGPPQTPNLQNPNPLDLLKFFLTNSYFMVYLVLEYPVVLMLALPAPSTPSFSPRGLPFPAKTLQFCAFVFNCLQDALPATPFLSYFCIVAGGWGGGALSVFNSMDSLYVRHWSVPQSARALLSAWQLAWPSMFHVEHS